MSINALKQFLLEVERWTNFCRQVIQKVYLLV